MSFIDAHAHLTYAEATDVESLLAKAASAGVGSIINVCTNLGDLERGLALVKTSSAVAVYNAAALTPHDAGKDDEAFFAEIVKRAESKELVAIGEIGLDYHYNFAPKDVQIATFKKYLVLARQHALPIVIHCREAFDDLVRVIDETAPDIAVMLHCFTGTVDEAKRAVDRGWYVSMSGIVTFPKSTALQDVAKVVPDNLLLIETDSPYLAPQGFRGQKNEPANIVHTAQFVANLRGMSVDDLGAITCENVKRLFHGVS
ncbi:MAG: TatD family hydrolase [Chlamydiales bacterium]|nr:TatD family hydrolase [Chlamydiales bacterium]